MVNDPVTDGIGFEYQKIPFSAGIFADKTGGKSGHRPNYIALIERGRKFPSSRLLEKVAQALDVNAVDLFSCQSDGIVMLHVELLKKLHQEILDDINSFMVKRMENLETKPIFPHADRRYAPVQSLSMNR